MTEKVVVISYKGQETKIEINLEITNTYSLFMTKIRSIITDYSTSNTYNIMTTNTAEPYTLLNDDNYMKVMKEEINGENLQLFLDKVDINPIENNENDNDIEDDDFVIEKSEEKKEEETTEEKPKEEVDQQLKIEQNINDNINNIINEKDDNENLYNETDAMINKIKNVLGQSNLQLIKHSNSVNYSQNDNRYNNSIINNKKKDNDVYNLLIDDDGEDEKENDINNEDMDLPQESKIINQDTFKSIKCSICNSNLSGIKYKCLVCESCILCSDCEMIHFHPCLKFKSNFLSSLSDIYKYITQFYSFKISSNNIFSKIFEKVYEINMAPLTDKKISLRPNREYFLPIKLINLSKEVITSSKFQIIPKNNKLINIYLEGNKKFTLGANSNFTVKLKCITGSIKGKETITFYGFSEQLTLKNREQLNFNIEFEINDDLEEEKINKEFNNNENIIMFSKEHKSLALELLKSVGDTDRTNAHIKKVFNALLLNNWKSSKEIINKINATKK
jgi:hypothetical protein